MEDQEIVQLFWERSESAIKETEIKYGARLHYLAMKILNSRLDAEESVNDTFLETWNTIPPKSQIISLPISQESVGIFRSENWTGRMPKKKCRIGCADR